MSDQFNLPEDSTAFETEQQEITPVSDDTTQANEETTQEHAVDKGNGFFVGTFDASKPVKISVTNQNGDIHVSATETDQVEIEAIPTGNTDPEDAPWFFQALDNEITLRPQWNVTSHLTELGQKVRDQLKGGFNAKAWTKQDLTFGLDTSFDLVVKLPRQLAADSQVNIKTANGDTEVRDVTANVSTATANGDHKVENVNGRVTAHTANGDAQLANIHGSVEANSANGDLTLIGGDGWLAMRTANGDIRVSDYTAKNGKVASVAGDITIDATIANSENYSIDTVSGDVSLTVKVPASGAALTYRSVSGDASISGAWEKETKRKWKIGDGSGPQIAISTVSGDVQASAESLTELVATSDSAAEAGDTEAAGETDAADATKDKEVNVNLDFELERAKGWARDLGGKLSALLQDIDARKPSAGESVVETSASTSEGETAPLSPEAPLTPKAPEAPQAPTEPLSPTAERRTRLLEAVKNGEMTVDEALAQLDSDPS